MQDQVASLRSKGLKLFFSVHRTYRVPQAESVNDIHTPRVRIGFKWNARVC